MKKCLFCKAEVPKKEKKCPNCGRKYVSRNWLIAIIVIAAILVIGIAGGNEENTKNKTTSSNTSTEENDSEKEKVYGLNEPITIENSTGAYTITLTGVEETADRNQFSDIEANRVIIISYTYENISSEDTVFISSNNFKVYDKDNNALESYPASIKYGESISTGRKTDASMAYALNNDQNYIELEYYDNMFNSKYDCIFKVEW